MIQEKSATGVVDDYLNALLFDTQLTAQETEQEEPVIRFARVEPGFELVAFWAGSLNKAQQLTKDFMLLSLCSSIPGQKLKRAVLEATSLVD